MALTPEQLSSLAQFMTRQSFVEKKLSWHEASLRVSQSLGPHSVQDIVQTFYSSSLTTGEVESYVQKLVSNNKAIWVHQKSFASLASTQIVSTHFLLK